MSTRLALAAALAFASIAQAQLPTGYQTLQAPARQLDLRAPAQTTQAAAPAQQQAAPARPGSFACALTENGMPANASVVLRQGDRIVASGSCALPFAVPAGNYVAALTLETTLDRPTQTQNVTIASDATTTARAEFSTSIVEVRFLRNFQLVAGMAIVQRDGRTVGTIGSGVVTRLTAGTYTVVARTATGDRSYAVVVAPDQRFALRVNV